MKIAVIIHFQIENVIKIIPNKPTVRERMVVIAKNATKSTLTLHKLFWLNVIQMVFRRKKKNYFRKLNESLWALIIYALDSFGSTTVVDTTMGFQSVTFYLYEIRSNALAIFYIYI